jgi:5-hydroxyisourate hydrolase-like protein (transthyretin family)
MKGRHLVSRRDRRPPGAARSLCLHERVALFGGSATVPELRRRGLQAALLQARMRYAHGAAALGDNRRRAGQRFRAQRIPHRLLMHEGAVGPGTRSPPCEQFKLSADNAVYMTRDMSISAFTRVSRLLVLLCLFFPGTIRAQPTGRIQGDVVDAVTGAPVARARVSVMASVDRSPHSLETSTDAEGRFDLSSLPAGDYLLFATKFGYLPGSTIRRGPTLRASENTRIHVTDGQPQRVRMALQPASLLLGRVLTADGEPVEGARVTLWRAASGGAKAHPVDNVMSETNDAGEFRLSRIEAGSYFLLVHSSSYTARRDGTTRVPTYYPAATSVADAVPIEVAQGATVTGLEIVVQDVKTATITGIVLDPRGIPLRSGDVKVAAERDGTRVPISLSGNARGDIQSDGTFQITLPPGDYWLSASTPESGGIGSISVGPEGVGKPMPTPEEMVAIMVQVQREELSRRASVSRLVSVGVEGLSEVTLQLQHEPPVMVSGRFVFEGRAPDPMSRLIASVDLLVAKGDEWSETRSRSLPQPNGAFEIAASPGTCLPRVITPAGWALKAIQADGVDITQRTLTLEAGRPVRDLRVIFTDQRNALSFQVVDPRGASTTEYVAIVFPTEERLWPAKANLRLYVPSATNAPRQRTPLDNLPEGLDMGLGARGDYSKPLGGLPPGDYYAIAIDDGTWDEVTDPAVLRRLAEKATRFQIREGESRFLELTRAVRAAF